MMGQSQRLCNVALAATALFELLPTFANTWIITSYTTRLDWDDKVLCFNDYCSWNN